MKIFFRNLKWLYEDAKNILNKDPAARNILTVMLLYPGFHILVWYRIFHFFYIYKMKFIARLLSQLRKIFYRNRNTSTEQK